MFRTIVEEQIEGIAIIDKNSTFTFANKAAEELFGVEKEGLIGKSLFNFIDDKSLDSFLTEIMACKEKGSGRFIVNINTLNGRKLILRFSAISHNDEDGNFNSLSIIFNDISDQKRIEDEVRMIATATRNANDCIFITDMEDKIIYANPAFLRTYQYESEQIFGKSAAILRSKNISPELLTEILQQTLEGGWKGEVLNVRKDGSEMLINLSTSLVRDDNGDAIAIIGIARDITHERQLNDELIKVQELEMIGYLARGIAHNFNNILTAIVGYISLAQISKDNEIKLTTNLAEAEKACSRARDLTQQLLGFSKGSGSLKRAASIKELIMDSATFAITGTNMECKFKIDDKLDTVEVDEGQISQVINNIVLNAAEASPKGGKITITAHNCSIKSRDNIALNPGDYITISIKDEGVGISNEHLTKVFNPFFTTKEKHTGLGLTTSFSIIRKHGGHILIESIVDKGSTFSIYLPISTKTVETEKEKELLPKPVGGRKILIMDDERDVRTILGSFLESYGYEVDPAVDGEQALTIFKETFDNHLQNKEIKKHDMAILNLTIPGGKGANEIIQDFKAIDPTVFVVLSTGHAKNDGIVKDYQNYGFQAVLLKPFDSHALNKILYELEQTISR